MMVRCITLFIKTVGVETTYILLRSRSQETCLKLCVLILRPTKFTHTFADSCHQSKALLHFFKTLGKKLKNKFEKAKNKTLFSHGLQNLSKQECFEVFCWIFLFYHPTIRLCSQLMVLLILGAKL